MLQNLYIELPMATVGSLSYAEDDNRHYLGVKAVVMQKDGKSQYCCYVLECENEASNALYQDCH